MRSVVLLALVAGCSSDAATTSGRVEFIAMVQTSDVAKTIAPEVARATREGRHPVVYVGATWCEPCIRFHEAAEHGELNARFGDVRFLMFDYDRDGDALDRAGYTSQYIPLFAIPNADGTASGRKIEGAEKKTDAVDQIAPKLRDLIDGH